MYNNNSKCKKKKKWVIAFAMALSLAQSGLGQSTLDNPVITNDLILHGGTVRNWGPMNFRSDYDQSGDQEFNFKYSNNTNFIRFLPATEQVDMSSAKVYARRLSVLDTIASATTLFLKASHGGRIKFIDSWNAPIITINPVDKSTYFDGAVLFNQRVDFYSAAVFSSSLVCLSPAEFSRSAAFLGSVSCAGTVGIGTGTFAPNYKLVVNGNVRANSFVTSAARFPDYVFEKDYSLLSLEELKSYTEKNKKLPGMPSQDEVLREGMDLNEVGIRSVEKIEELYLYIFQMNEKMKQLEQELKLLKQQ